MPLMSLVRWIGVLVIGWTLVAIGIGATGTRVPDRGSSARSASASRSVEAMPTNWPLPVGYELIDRADGRRMPIRLPAGERWWDVSVCPWRGPAGEIEAVGRWSNSGRADFRGWAIFRVSDGTVLGRVATEILPTGRPCWVPGEPRTILSAAGDGRLYRCRLPDDGEETVVFRPPIYASGFGDPSDPVAWEAPLPGSRRPVLLDPVWPTGPGLGRWVFAALMPVESQHGRQEIGLPQIWWLEMSEGARAVVAVGRLTGPTEGDAVDAGVEQRFPNVAIGPRGELRLVYLERRDRETTYRLRSSRLEVDPRTGRPRLVTDRGGLTGDSPLFLQPSPLLVSEDGATVFGISTSGRIGAWPLIPTRDQTGRVSRASAARTGGEAGLVALADHAGSLHSSSWSERADESVRRGRGGFKPPYRSPGYVELSFFCK